jgi:hypothetical protein
MIYFGFSIGWNTFEILKILAFIEIDVRRINFKQERLVDSYKER